MTTKTENSDETSQILGDILVGMVKAQHILVEVNDKHDSIRIDRHEKGMFLYDSDKCLQESLMCLADSIMYIKHEINMLDGEV